MTNSKINLLHLINGFAIGGAEKHLLQSIYHTDKQKFNIYICSVGQGGSLREEFEKTGFMVEVFPKKASFDFSLIYKVAELIRRERIDIIQTTLFYADMIGTLATRFSFVPVIISVEHGSHGKNDPLRVSSYHVLSYRWAMKHVQKIVAVSHEIRNSIIRYRKISPEKVITIHNGIDLTKYKEIDILKKKTEFHLSQDELIIGIIARLDEVKGHKYLFRALANLITEFPTVKCLIIGDGPLRKVLEVEINSLGLTSNVIFCGFRHDVLEILQIIDILVLPSISEGLPIILLEAMSCKKPIVASKVGGIPEVVVDDVTGSLVPSKDVNALSDTLKNLLKDHELREKMGLEGRRRVEEFFSVKREVEQYERLYLSYFENRESPNKA